jgi:class 3 adenylate cyclase
VEFEFTGQAVRVSVENRMPESASAWVVEYPQVPQVFEPIEFGAVLSAKRLLSTQTLRVLFRSETVAAGESLEIRDLTFLFTDLRDSTAMYERIGDATAYNLVRLHFDALEAAIRDCSGAIVKTIGDAIMATFVSAADGVQAAMRMPERLDEFNRTSSTDLVLKMGLHRGDAIAITSSDSVDYFG